MLERPGDLIPVLPNATSIPWTRRRSQILNFLHRGPVTFQTLVYDTNVGDISALATYFNPDRISERELNLRFGHNPTNGEKHSSGSPPKPNNANDPVVKPRLLLYPDHNLDSNQVKVNRTLNWVLSQDWQWNRFRNQRTIYSWTWDNSSSPSTADWEDWWTTISMFLTPPCQLQSRPSHSRCPQTQWILFWTQFGQIKVLVNLVTGQTEKLDLVLDSWWPESTRTRRCWTPWRCWRLVGTSCGEPGTAAETRPGDQISEQHWQQLSEQDFIMHVIILCYYCKPLTVQNPLTQTLSI